jgi:hypothetical protein
MPSDAAGRNRVSFQIEPAVEADHPATALVQKKPANSFWACTSRQAMLLLAYLAITSIFLGFSGGATLKSGFVEPVRYWVTYEYHLIFYLSLASGPVVFYFIILEGIPLHARRMETPDIQLAFQTIDAASRPSAIELVALLTTPLLFGVEMALRLSQQFPTYDWDWIQRVINVAGYVGFTRLALIMRAMLLAMPVDDKERHLTRWRRHVKIVVLVQAAALFLLAFNLYGTRPVLSKLANQHYDGPSNCSTSVPPGMYDEYHVCLCAELTPTFYEHECNLTSGAEALSIAREPTGFTLYVCEVRPQWRPYRNALEACRAYTSWPVQQFLAHSAQYTSWGLSILWPLVAYDSLAQEDIRHAGGSPDIASSVARQVFRLCAAFSSVVLVMYACVQVKIHLLALKRD